MALLPKARIEMAEAADKATKSAEMAYAAAAEEAKLAAGPKTEAPKTEAKTEEAAVASKPRPRPVAKATPKPKKKTTKPISAKPASKPKRPAKAAKVMEPASPAQPTIIQLKEKIMASSKTTDFTKTVSDVMTDMQSRAQTAYEKSTEMAGEMTEFTKGNVEAMVEAGKLFAAGMQDIGKTYAEDTKNAYEAATADVKEMVAVKSPTELFQLQGKLARRNFDAMVAFGSKQTETLMKLTNESFAPISSRLSIAAEKISKAA
jgi:phasin family protein